MESSLCPKMCRGVLHGKKDGLFAGYLGPRVNRHWILWPWLIPKYFQAVLPRQAPAWRRALYSQTFKHVPSALFCLVTLFVFPFGVCFIYKQFRYFYPNSLRIHWLLRGHVTSNNKTFSCQKFLSRQHGTTYDVRAEGNSAVLPVGHSLRFTFVYL